MRRAYWIVTAVYWAGIFTLTHLPANRIPPTRVSDKVGHMAAYGILGILLFASLRASQWTIRQACIGVLGIGMIYGALDELLQIPVGRVADIKDWFADVTGLAFATVICVAVERMGRKPEARNQKSEEMTKPE